MRDSYWDDTRAVASLVPATRTNGTANGTPVDTNLNRQNFRVAFLVAFAGVITDGTHAAKMQESPDGSTGWVDIPTSGDPQRLQAVTLPLPNLATNAVQEVGIIVDPLRPFLRAVVTTAGATTGGVSGAVILLGQPAQTPVIRP